MAWSSSEEQYLRENYGTLSSSHIARYIGKSKDAIIAKADRLGLSSNLKPWHGFDRSEILAEKRREITVKFPHRPDCIDMIDLKVGQCRWPCGDQFCGRAAISGKSYCPEHHKKAHV